MRAKYAGQRLVDRRIARQVKRATATAARPKKLSAAELVRRYRLLVLGKGVK